MKPRPRIQIQASDEQWQKLSAAAARAEIGPNTLAGALLRWAWPLFEAGNFEVPALKDRFGEGQGLVAAIESNQPGRRRPAPKPKAS